MAEKLIVIGGTAAGLSAASKARRLKKDMDILVFEKSGYISYGACGLPYFAGGLIDDADDLVSLHVDEVREKRNISVLIHREVTSIDRENKTVAVVNLDDGSKAVYPYDKLCIATGASPVKPDIPGAESGSIFYLRNVEDGIKLKNAAQKGQTAAIIGGGFVGLESAEALSAAGLKVHLFESSDRLLPVLPESFSDEVLKTLITGGVIVHTGEAVSEIKVRKGRASSVMTKSHDVTSDIVLISAGVTPNSGLAKEAGLKTGVRDAIAVDDTMRTEDESIWACGDCAEMKHSLTGRQCWIPLGTTANKPGRIAGSNIGGEEAHFHGVLGSMVTKVFDCYVAATGLTLSQARAEGFDAEESEIRQRDRASYYPGAKPMFLNLVFDAGTGRLLGAAALGSEGAALRIDTLAAAIDAGMTVSELNELDLIYAPPVAPVYDPILIAASQAMKKVRK